MIQSWRNIWTIAKRDLRSYFASPLAYILIASFLLIMGYLFTVILQYFALQSSRYNQMNYGKAISLADGVLRPLFGNMNVIFLFLVPGITMRLFAEEKKQHTLELLLTAPITLWEIILGKFLSSMLLVSSILLVTIVYPLILWFTGNPELGPILTTYLGTLLLYGCYLSTGVLFSAMTENQFVAYFLSLIANLFFWLISWAANTAGPFWGEFFTYVALISHFNNFSQGIIHTSDIVYYLSFMGIGLFLTHRVLDSYRWR